MDTLIGIVLYILLVTFCWLVGFALGVLIDVVPPATHRAWQRWRDRRLQGQGSVVLRRHRARLEYTS